MAEESGHGDASAAATGAAQFRGAPAIAESLNALALSGASREKADAFLDEQIALARLQREDMDEQRGLEAMRLREQSKNLRLQSRDQLLSLGLKVVGGLFVLFLVTGFGAMVWSSAQQSGLVIDAFSVPPDMAQRGLTAQAVATHVLDKLARMEKQTRTPWVAAHSSREAQDIKIAIPDTGISVGELMRYLRGWLGSEVHVSGEVFRTDDGISITARYGDQPGETVSGTQKQFDALLEKAAEQIYRQSQPIRFADYLTGLKRYDEALKVLMPLTRKGTLQAQAFALASVSTLYVERGEWATALRYGRQALTRVPGDAVAHLWLGEEEDASGHNEAALREFRASLAAFETGHVEGVDSRYVEASKIESTVMTADYTDDYQAAIAAGRRAMERGLGSIGFTAMNYAYAHDPAAALLVAQRLSPVIDNGLPSEGPAFFAFALESERQNWKAALAAAIDSDVRHVRIDTHDTLERLVRHFPMIAIARAKTKDFIGAHRIIDYTPLDCYDCMVTRGRIRAEEKNQAAASFWFARAESSDPSLPMAAFRWGEMLLNAHDFDGAIAKFERAHQKGPHFADPLEMWGEALMLKNRSDLALSKFEEAGRYAPNWGRLHLKWGEALMWSGDGHEAQKQFAIASKLDLTTTDRNELARMSAKHG